MSTDTVWWQNNKKLKEFADRLPLTEPPSWEYLKPHHHGLITAGSSSGRTGAFEASSEGSIPSPASKHD